MASVDQVLGAQTAASGFFNPMIGGLGGAVSVGGGGAASPAAFDIEGGKVVRCGLAFGRQWLTCNDTAVSGLDEPDGVIYAKVTHGSGDPQLTVEQGDELPENALDVTHRLLYAAAGGTWADYRSAPAITAMD